MAFTWGDWLRFVLIPLIIAAVTAIVATRNAKKTPHERLKNLVDIHKIMPDGLDSRNVVESAIARELVDFDRRMAADQRGFWAGMKERLAQLRAGGMAVVFVGAGCVPALGAGFIDRDSWNIALALAIAFFVAAVATLTGRFVSKGERRSLERARISAEIGAQFPRVEMQAVSIYGQIEVAKGEHYFSVAQRLVDQGVFEPKPAATSPDGRQVVSFVLTRFGREVWDAALADTERQHIAHWEDIAREGRERDGKDSPESEAHE